MSKTRRCGAAAAAGTIAALSLTVATGPALASAHPAHHRAHHSSHHHRHHPAARAGRDVFVQTDATTGNQIVVYRRAEDGTLAAAGTYATGGDGGILNGSVVDHLASQDSLTYDRADRLLFAVNAGSDTISVLSVDGDRLQLRQVLASGGRFPVSIAVHGDLVYVLNALDGASLRGFSIADRRLSPIAGSDRQLGLDAATDTTQFVTTPGDIAFTPDGRELVLTTKATGNDIDVFRVRAGGGLGAPVVNSEPGAVPFALAFEGDDQVAVGEAGTDSVQTFALANDGKLTALSSAATGQKATCWLVADGPALFAGNAASGSESTIVDGPFGFLQDVATTSTDAGTVDAAVSPDGRYLYVQTGAAGIVDEFRVSERAGLTEIGTVTVPGAVGGEGIAVS